MRLNMHGCIDLAKNPDVAWSLCSWPKPHRCSTHHPSLQSCIPFFCAQAKFINPPRRWIVGGGGQFWWQFTSLLETSQLNRELVDMQRYYCEFPKSTNSACRPPYTSIAIQVRSKWIEQNLCESWKLPFVQWKIMLHVRFAQAPVKSPYINPRCNLIVTLVLSEAEWPCQHTGAADWKSTLHFFS